ncbi:Putative ribonuclease H protein At1g65750, partial [Linum perenne]
IDWSSFRRWAHQNWASSLDVDFQKLGDGLWLLECGSSEKVKHILALDRWCFGRTVIQLDRWIPVAGRSGVLLSDDVVWDERGGTGQVNHILYADDALVFCDASESQVRSLAATLVCFECITGLKINFHKSAMFTVGTVQDPIGLASVFGCHLDQLPSTYLGLPLGSRCTSTLLWDHVISNMERKLETWKTHFLSFGGRLTLLKSVISSLPVYYMSLLKAPSSVIARLESLQKRFLWTGTTDPKKLHWIHWDTIKCSKSRGGLRVQDLRILNTALLSKWTWRYATERSAWWRTLISSKCGTGPSDWISIWNFSSSGYSMWKGVIAFGSIFWTYGSIDPGGGMCDFWRDYWVRGMRLASLFPRIAASAQSLDARLCNVCHFSDRLEWSIPLRYQLS